MKTIEVTPLSGALGAEITGVNLSRALTAGAVATILTVLRDHLVVFFRDQNLQPESLAAVAHRLGTVGRYPFVEPMPGQPDVIEIVKEPQQTSNFGGIWHTDTSYLQQPPAATLLYAVETPAVGGDTVFANLYRAFETLSPAFQQFLAPLTAINSAALTADQVRGAHLASGSMPSGEAQASAFSAEHRLVRQHPASGRTGLYFSPAHTERFTAMSAEESVPIIRYLTRHATRPELCCRFGWRPGSLALWDNRCALHCAINDYDGQRRVMHRVSMAELDIV